MKARENKSDIESELESKDPIEADDMVFSEEESQEVIVTSAMRRDPTAMFAGNEQEVERRAVVPMLRKRVASTDANGEREAKRTRSPRPLVASPVSSPPTVDTAEQARRCEEQACTYASPGPVLMCDLQLEDAPSTASVEASRVEGRGDPQAG